MRVTRLILLFGWIICTGARADLLHVPFEGVRPAGMGNAFIAIADGDDALWYNPAALTQIKGNHLSLIDLTLGADSRGTLSRLMGAGFGGNYNALLTSGPMFFRAGMRMTYVQRYFSACVYDSVQSFSDLENLDTLGATAKISSNNDIGVNVGAALPLGDYLSIGGSLRAFERTALDANLNAQDLVNRFGSDAQFFSKTPYTYLKQLMGLGWAIGGTFGVYGTLPMTNKTSRITFGGTVEDIGGTTFRTLGHNPPPATIPVSYNLGTALHYTLARDSELSTDVDFRNMGQGLPFLMQFHLGAEYRYSLFSLRAGFYEGHVTYGAGVRIQPHTRIQFSSYAVETGSSFGESSQRWFLLQLVIGFNPI